jgi:hypothetical protein
VISALQQMVGPRERCVWCVDSRAADVEHYRPKARFPEAVFVWDNLLWACHAVRPQEGGAIPSWRRTARRCSSTQPAKTLGITSSLSPTLASSCRGWTPRRARQIRSGLRPARQSSCR